MNHFIVTSILVVFGLALMTNDGQANRLKPELRSFGQDSYPSYRFKLELNIRKRLDNIYEAKVLKHAKATGFNELVMDYRQACYTRSRDIQYCDRIVGELQTDIRTFISRLSLAASYLDNFNTQSPYSFGLRSSGSAQPNNTNDSVKIEPYIAVESSSRKLFSGVDLNTQLDPDLSSNPPIDQDIVFNPKK